VPVLIDGPCNEWWSAFGTNPNCAWLVTSEGIVYDAEQWFDRYPDNINEAIANLLDEEPGGGGPDPDGYFTVEPVSDDCTEGFAGETILFEVTVTNLDDIDTYIDVLKQEESLPAGWETSICTDVCYPPSVDSVNLYLEAGESEVLHIYFYTNDVAGNGISNILLRNHYNTEQQYTITAKACAAEGTEIQTGDIPGVKIFPNPVQTVMYVASDKQITNGVVQIDDVSGKRVLQSNTTFANGIMPIDVTQLTAGIYFLTIADGKDITAIKFLKQ
jgi:hypothetical protein